MRRPNVFTIPAGVPFLPTLADAILSGTLTGTAPDPHDPMALADITVLLPTRRSVRALRQILIASNPARAAILPRIRTIGDEEDFLLEPTPEDPRDALVLPPVVSRLERNLVLARLILAWGRTVRRSLLALGPDQPLLIPASAGDAFHLAGDLARLIDDMETAGIEWDALHALTPEDYPGYWQLTLDFLKIAAEQWPAYLAERGLADPALRRDRLIRLAADRLARSRGPVVAAGSTGSIPATAMLLRAIAGSPSGAVVLPGLDAHLDAKTWDDIADPGDQASGSPSHPQFGLRHLLARIGLLRDDVVALGAPSLPLATRVALVAEAMRPAETTDAWSGVDLGDADRALAEVGLIVARNEQEEALAIAVALRESIENGVGTAALVTPDRTLASRVAVELGRWQIRVDDSAGRSLDATPPGIFARLIASAALAPNPVQLLAALKHPLAAFGMMRHLCRRAARALELAAFRGPGASGRADMLARELVNLRLAVEMKSDRFPPQARKRLSPAEWTAAETMARTIGSVLGPLAAMVDRPTASVAELTALLLDAIERAADDKDGSISAFWNEPAGRALATLLTGLLEAGSIELAPAEYPGFLQAAMAGATVTPEAGADPRVHVWGTLEGRLQSVDLLILGGLDEGVWPGETRTDPWLSRQMREAVGLPPPERRIGLSAHDFTQAIAAPRVLVSRAEKRGGAPTVPSRWLQRLEAVLGPERIKGLVRRGHRHVSLARALDQVKPKDIRPVARPEPRPPVAVRPRELSVTSIETLIRDPYAIYARRILQLEPLEPLGQRADARLRGSLIHDALANFTKDWLGKPFDPAARERLLALWRTEFAAIAAFPEVHVVWTLLAPRIADWIVRWEADRDADVASRHAEIKGELAVEAPGGPFKLTGRADRIDILKDGAVGIYDYKTGAPPSAKQVLVFQPQLALEGAMIQAGAFGPDFSGRSIAEVAWIGLGMVGKGDPLRSAIDEGLTADGIAAEAYLRLHKLVAAYDDPQKSYPSQARPMFERRWPGDYDHLARVAEWRLAARPAP
ncbi:MAG: double-strand break repair protein AddB [Bauldia sp.]